MIFLSTVRFTCVVVGIVCLGTAFASPIAGNNSPSVKALRHRPWVDPAAQWMSLSPSLLSLSLDGDIGRLNAEDTLLPPVAVARIVSDEQIMRAWQYVQSGVSHNKRQRFARARESYQSALYLDPPVEATPEQIALALRLAPLLRCHESEVFPLKTAAVVLHPNLPIIAYHLFWADDIDYPDDKQPADHEIVWVVYDAGQQLEAVYSYFHGAVLKFNGKDIAEAKRIGRPLAFVEWGKHGTIPPRFTDTKPHHFVSEMRGKDIFSRLGKWLSIKWYLRFNYARLNETGIRKKKHDESKAWPKFFKGSFPNYLTFKKDVDMRSLLAVPHNILVSRWGSAVLSTEHLGENFSAKADWPKGFAYKPPKVLRKKILKKS